MHIFELNTPELAEAAILLAGALVLTIGAIHLTRRKGWAAAIKCVPLRPLSFLPSDIGIAICLFMLMGQFLFSIHSSVTGLPMPTSQPAGRDAAGSDIQLMTVITATAQCINIVLIFLVVAIRLKGDFESWGLSLRRFGLRLGQAVLIFLAFWPMCAGLLHLSKWIMVETGYQTELKEHSAILLLQSGNGPAWLAALTVISAVVFAPILEEILFRGLLFRFLSEFWPSSHAAMAASAVLFGLIHFTSPQTVPPLMLFGLVLAFAYAKTHSLTLVILIHVVFNLKTIVLIFWGAKS